MSGLDHDPSSARARVIAAASELLADGGPTAVSTRAVSERAGVHAPAIYRLFGDKQGLLDAVIAAGFAGYVADTSPVDGGDPVEQLWAGCEHHIEVGLAQPHLYRLMVSALADGARTEATDAGSQVLAERVRRVARDGRLQVSEAQAIALIEIVCQGVTLKLIATPAEDRDLAIADLAIDMLIGAITTDSKPRQPVEPATTAVTLRALLPQTDVLTPGESALMDEWLQRIADRR